MESEAHEQKPKPIWGALAISKVIAKTERATYKMLEQGVLPARKVGGRWQTEQGALERWLADEPIPQQSK